MPTTPTHWTLAARAAKMNPSVIREILKVTEKPGIISFAGGLPSSKTFPVAEFDAACAKVLRDDPAGARVLDDLRFQRFEAVDVEAMERLGSLVGAC